MMTPGMSLTDSHAPLPSCQLILHWPYLLLTIQTSRCCSQWSSSSWFLWWSWWWCQWLWWWWKWCSWCDNCNCKYIKYIKYELYFLKMYQSWFVLQGGTGGASHTLLPALILHTPIHTIHHHNHHRYPHCHCHHHHQQLHHRWSLPNFTKCSHPTLTPSLTPILSTLYRDDHHRDHHHHNCQHHYHRRPLSYHYRPHIMRRVSSLQLRYHRPPVTQPIFRPQL